MKKLRNKKTGEIKIIDEVLLIKDDDGDCWSVGRYASLAELNDEWEDYKSAEPLIKDEKIRKAVRAWAEVCGLSYVTYKQASNEFCDPDTRGAFAIRFRLIPVEVYLEDGGCYTIAELCGEEEKCES